ncbi:FliM/FliN family flagellar motor C-terminal domain-containing protein [Sedimentitalea todarodis]|uniref:FliM/FliN family flagellar motor switch protein n=1 Tax=Sedimentitalea todarodis TaxID=1631240 RepID=A0ABU3V8M7_9RHOB|nr:FliM/FliN family flagellar motor switch protein [Sedimentitalea todarodis]MDU9002510.1 FliM/FliN family flagellar motor switch protein [Sedimentitalea todarodis]
MVTSESNSAIRRKTDTNREGVSGAGRSAAGALRLGIARSAANLFDLAISVIGIRQARAEQDAIGRHLSDERLLILLDGPPGLTGALVLDRALMVALVQQQTMGRVTATPPDERPFTATDAAMAAPLVDATLERAAKLAELPADVLCLTGFRFGAHVEDRRSALLALDADVYRVFDLTLELDGGPLQGEMCLILPEPKPQAETTRDASTAQDPPTLGHAIGVARADLIAVISRMRVPLADFSKMQPGDLLPLVQERLDRIELVSITGQKVAVGRLGQAGGLRALRLNEMRTPTLADRDAFASGTGAKATALDDPMTVEGHLVDPEVDPAGVDVLSESETEEDYSGMSPEDAAVEISALAGLRTDEAGGLEEPSG